MKNLGDGVFEVSGDDLIFVQCECGKVWSMDYEPTPKDCNDKVWRLRAGGEWGVWVDKNGNEVTVEREPEHKMPEVWE